MGQSFLQLTLGVVVAFVTINALKWCMTRNSAFQPQDFMTYLLNRAAEATSQAFQKSYKSKYGMLRTEWRVLFHLGCYGDLTAKDISLRADLHKTKISRAVAALEMRRFLSRRTRPEDRRHEVLTLTKLGQSAFHDLIGDAERYNEALMAPFSAQEQALLRRLLLSIAAEA